VENCHLIDRSKGTLHDTFDKIARFCISLPPVMCVSASSWALREWKETISKQLVSGRIVFGKI